MRYIRPDCLRTSLLIAAAALSLCATPVLAQAGTITISFSGTVTSAFGDLGGVLSVGDTVSGTIELDDTIVGAFTPGTVFLRAEMLYSGAVLSSTLLVNGSPVSGVGGDVTLFDSDGLLNGDDVYEASGVVDVGTVAGIPLATFDFRPAYDDPAFTLTAGTPLFAPPPIDPASANRIQLDSVSGGTASCDLDSFSVAAGPPSVPVLTPLGLGLALAALTGLVVRSARRSGPHASR